MLSSIGRAAIGRVVAGRPQSTNRATHSIWQLQRASRSKAGGYGLLCMSRRSYATTTKVVAAEPKSKSTSAKAKTSVKSSAKAASTKVAAKKPVRPAKKAVKKPVGRPKKKPVKKILTPEEKERQTIKALRKQALTNPKKKAANAWLVYLEQQSAKLKDGNGVIPKMPAISQSFKELSPVELESLNHTANQNKSENSVVFREWVESYPPEVINRANNARRMLAKKYNKKMQHRILDPRIPKSRTVARLFFVKDRYASGDMKGLTVVEATKLITGEWNALSPSEKKPYEDLAEQDRVRYVQEFRAAFHKDTTGGLRVAST